MANINKQQPSDIKCPMSDDCQLVANSGSRKLWSADINIMHRMSEWTNTGSVTGISRSPVQQALEQSASRTYICHLSFKKEDLKTINMY